MPSFNRSLSLLTLLIAFFLSGCLDQTELSSKATLAASSPLDIPNVPASCPAPNWGFRIHFRNSNLPKKLSVVVNNETLVDECASVSVSNKIVQFQRLNNSMLQLDVMEPDSHLPSSIEIAVYDLDNNCKAAQPSVVYTKTGFDLFYELRDPTDPACPQYREAVRPTFYKL